MASNTTMPSSRPDVGGTSKVQSARDAYGKACAEAIAYLREQKSRSTVRTAVQPLDMMQLPDDSREMGERIAQIVHKFQPPTVDATEWLQMTLDLGDTLARYGEYGLASSVCYRVCIRSPEPCEGDLCETDSLAAHVRAVYGLSMAGASAARMRDVRMESVATLSQLLLCLQRVQSAMQLLVSARPASVKEELYYLIHNGAVCTLALAEPMLTFEPAAARRVLHYLNWCILAVECTPNLASPRHLSLRVRLYGAVCRGYERCGIAALVIQGAGAGTAAAAAKAPLAKGATPASDASAAALPALDDESVAKNGQLGLHLYGARAAVGRALRTVNALHRMYKADPPLVEATMAAIDAARIELSVRRFVYDSRLSVSAAAARLSLDVASQAARVMALVAALSWNHGQLRRVVRHTPPGFEMRALLASACEPGLPRPGGDPDPGALSEAEKVRVQATLALLLKEVRPALEALLPLARLYASSVLDKLTRKYGRPSALKRSPSPNAKGESVGVVMVQDGEGGGAALDYRVEIRAVEASPGGRAIPVHVHCALLRLAFSYEAWPEFVLLLHTVEARLDVAADGVRDGGQANSKEEDGEEDLAALALAEVELSTAVHEACLLRRLYELEFGAMPVPLLVPTGTGAGEGEAQAGGVKAGTVPVPSPGKAGAPPTPSAPPSLSLSPLALATAAGYASAVPLPFINVTPVQLNAVAEALLACTRHLPRADAPTTLSVAGVGLAASRTDILHDALLVCAEHASALSAWRDSRDVGTERDAARKGAVSDALFMLYRACHAAAGKTGLSDAPLRAEIGLRFALLCAERDDVIQAVQVIRATLAAVSAARDKQLSIAPRLPLFSLADGEDSTAALSGRDSILDDEDVVSLSYACVTASRPPRELVEALREPGSEPADRSAKHAWGARSVTWTSSATLSAWHADIIAVWATLEMRYGAWQAQQGALMGAKRARLDAAKKAAAESRRRPKKGTRTGAGSSALVEEVGEEEADTRSVVPAGTATDADEYAELLAEAIAAEGPVFKGWKPSAPTFARLLSECRRNHAWKALVHLSSVHWAYDMGGRHDALSSALDSVHAAEEYESSLHRTMVGRLSRAAGLSWVSPESVGREGGDEAYYEGQGGDGAYPDLRSGERQDDASKSKAKKVAESTLVLDSGKGKDGKTVIIDPSTGLIRSIAGANAYQPPLLLCRTNSSMTLTPCAYPDSQAGHPVHVSRATPPSPVHHYVLYGKAYGTGTEVAASCTGLTGTGVPCHTVSSGGGGVLNDVWASAGDVETFARRAVPAPAAAGRGTTRAPGLAFDESDPHLPRQAGTILSRCLSVTVTGLVPNEAYNFAAGAVTVAGQLAGDAVSLSTPPIVAATPLPLPLLYSYVACEAARIGEAGIARVAASRVASVYVAVGPGSAQPSPFVLRRELLSLAPRAVQSALVRCLLILAETGEGGMSRARLPGGAEQPDTSGTGMGYELHMLRAPTVQDGDGWSFHRAEEGKSADGSGGHGYPPYTARLQAAALRRCFTAALAVDVACAVRDPALMQAAACVTLAVATPLLTLTDGKPSHLLLQPLATAYTALRALPRPALQPPAQRALARLTYELTLACLHGGPTLPPAYGMPASTRDSVYARIVLGGGGGSKLGADRPPALHETRALCAPPALPDLKSVAPGWVSPHPTAPTLPWRARREYSPWSVEVGGVQDLALPPALAEGYGFYPGTHGGFKSDADTLAREFDDVPSADRASLAAFLLSTPRLFGQVEGSPSVGGGKVDEASWLGILSAVSAGVGAGANPSLSSCVEVWSAARVDMGGALEVVAAKYMVVGGAGGAKAAPAPATGKAPAKGAAPAAPASGPPVFHPSFLPLITLLLSTALTGAGAGSIPFPTPTPSSLLARLLPAIQSTADSVGAYAAGAGGDQARAAMAVILALASSGGADTVASELGDGTIVGMPVAVLAALTVLRPLLLAALVHGEGGGVEGSPQGGEGAVTVYPLLHPSHVEGLRGDIQRNRMASFLTDILALGRLDRETEEVYGAMGGGDGGGNLNMSVQSFDGGAGGGSSVNGSQGHAGRSLDESLLHRIVRPPSPDAALLSTLGLAPSWTALRVADNGTLPPPLRQAALAVSHIDLIRVHALHARLQGVAAATSAVEDGGAVTGLVWRGGPQPSGEDGEGVYARPGPYSLQGHLLFLLDGEEEEGGPGQGKATTVRAVPADWARAEPQCAYVADSGVPRLSTLTLSNPLPTLRLLLSAASDAAIAARACCAWSTLMASVRAAWGGVGLAWAGPHWYGHMDGAGHTEPAPAPEAGHGGHELHPDPNAAWRTLRAIPSLHVPTRPAILDWRPLWRISLALLDMLAAVGEGRVESVWGRGLHPGCAYKAGHEGGGEGGDMDSQAGGEEEEEEEGGQGTIMPGLTVTQRVRMEVEAKEDEEGGGNGDDPTYPPYPELPPGMSRDDITTCARFIAYTALALLHAQEWTVLAAFGGRVQEGYPAVLRLLGGRDAISQSADPGTPDVAWSGVGGGVRTCPPLDMSERGEARAEPFGFVLYPGYFQYKRRDALVLAGLAVASPFSGHGGAMGDDALAVAVRLAAYAARVRWSEAEEQLGVVQREADAARAAFDSRPSLAAAVKRKRTSVLEQQAVLDGEEVAWAANKSVYDGRIATMEAVVAVRTRACATLHAFLARHGRDMSLPRRLLRTARSTLCRYVHFTSAGRAGSVVHPLLPYASQACLPLDVVVKAVGSGEESRVVRGGHHLALLRTLREGMDRTGRGGDGGDAACEGGPSSLSPSLHSTLSLYGSLIVTLRKRRETVLLVQAHMDVGALHWARAGEGIAAGGRAGDTLDSVQAAFCAWKDGLDACFNTLDAHVRWRDLVGGMRSRHRVGGEGVQEGAGEASALFELHGLAGCLLPALCATRMAAAIGAAKHLCSAHKEAEDALPSHLREKARGSNPHVLLASSLGEAAVLDLHLLAALCINATFKACAPLLHPPADHEFSRHRPSVWVPGVAVAGDERLLSPAALVDCLRSIAHTLLSYGPTYAERALPSIVALEHMACYSGGGVGGGVPGVVDASCLRGTAQCRLGDVEGAVDTLSSLVRGDCPGLPASAQGVLPATLYTSLAPPLPGRAPPVTAAVPGGKGAPATKGAPAVSAATGSVPPTNSVSGHSEGSLSIRPSPPSSLPRWHNHLPPSHPLNRAALSWLAAPASTTLPSPLAVLCSRELRARVHLLRAHILRTVLACTRNAGAHMDFFSDLGTLPSLEASPSWYAAAARASMPAMLNRGALSDVLDDVEEREGAGLGAGLTAAQLKWPLPLGGGAGGAKGAPTPPSAPGLTPEDASALALDSTWQGAVMAGARAAVSAALGEAQGGGGTPVLKPSALGLGEEPSPTVPGGAGKPSTAGTPRDKDVVGEGGAAAPDSVTLATVAACASEAAELAYARGEHRVAVSASAAALTCLCRAQSSPLPPLFRAVDTRLAPRHNLPTWLRLRLLTGEALLCTGAVGEAEEVLVVGGREAEEGGDGLSADRLLLARAAAATLIGSLQDAFTCLSAIIQPALPTLTPLSTADGADFATSPSYALHAVPDPVTLSKAITTLVGLERTVGAFAPAHLAGKVDCRQMPITTLLKLLCTASGPALGMAEAVSAAREVRLLLLAERLVRARLAALGVDVHAMDAAAEACLRADGGLPGGSLVQSAIPRSGRDGLYTPDMEALAEIRDMLGDALVDASLSKSACERLAAHASAHKTGAMTPTQAGAALTLLAARKRSQQLVVCHHLAAVQPSMLVCASLGVARCMRLWLVGATNREEGDGPILLPPAVESQLLMAAELHSIVAFEASRVMCEHDPGLLRHASLELSRLYALSARRALTGVGGSASGPVDARADQALRYCLSLHALSARLGVMTQRGTVGKQGGGVAKAAAAAAAGAKGGKSGGGGDDEALRALLPRGLWEDIAATRRAADASAAAVQDAATAQPGAPKGAARSPSPSKSGAPTSTVPPASLLLAHMFALHGMMRAVPSAAGPMASFVEDACQSLHSALTVLMPEFRSAWGLSKSLAGRLSSAAGAGGEGAGATPPLSVALGPANPSSLRITIPAGPLAMSLSGLSATVITRDDEAQEEAEDGTALLILLLGPGVGSGTRPGTQPTGAPTPRPTDALYVRLPLPSHALLACREEFAGLRARHKALLDPGAAAALACVNSSGGGVGGISASGAPLGEWSGGDTSLGVTLEVRRVGLAVEAAAGRLASLLRGAMLPSHSQTAPTPDLVGSMKAGSGGGLTPTPTPTPAKGGKPVGSGGGLPPPGYDAGDDGGEDEDDAALTSGPSADPTLIAGLRACDALAKLCDHRYGGATRHVGVNSWLREVLEGQGQGGGQGK